MNLKETGINTRNWVDSTQDRDYWRPCECGIEPPGSVSPGIRCQTFQTFWEKIQVRLKFFPSSTQHKGANTLHEGRASTGVREEKQSANCCTKSEEWRE